MAKVVKEFRGVPDGSPYVRTFAVGDHVEGDLARVALAEKWAVDGSAPSVSKLAVSVKALDAKAVLDLVEPMKADFLAWKARAVEVLGEDCPAKKADIIEALKARAAGDAKA